VIADKLGLLGKIIDTVMKLPGVKDLLGPVVTPMIVSFTSTEPPDRVWLVTSVFVGGVSKSTACPPGRRGFSRANRACPGPLAMRRPPGLPACPSFPGPGGGG
jgi:hypothetical protein